MESQTPFIKGTSKCYAAWRWISEIISRVYYFADWFGSGATIISIAVIWHANIVVKRPGYTILMRSSDTLFSGREWPRKTTTHLTDITSWFVSYTHFEIIIPDSFLEFFYDNSPSSPLLSHSLLPSHFLFLKNYSSLFFNILSSNPLSFP